jgi:methionyl-tRNA formyltransferase
MSRTLNPKSSLHIGVISKHEVYFGDIKKSLTGLDVEVFYASEIEHLTSEISSGVNFDYLFFPHFSKIIPPTVFNNVLCVGFHTGDLPKDRGGSPIQNKILKKQYATKVSAFVISETLDGGDLLCQRDVDLENGSIKEMINSISILVSEMVREIVTQRPEPVPQIGEAEYFERISPILSGLELSSLCLKDIYDRVRMVDGFNYPSAYIQIGDFKLNLSDAQFLEGKLHMKCIVEEI